MVFACALSIAVKTPRCALGRYALPRGAFSLGGEFRPVLHLREGAATAFAKIVALAGRANGNARRVGCGLVPGIIERNAFLCLNE